MATPLPTHQEQLIAELEGRLLHYQEEIALLKFQWAKYKTKRKELRRLPKNIKAMEQDRRVMYSLARQLLCCRKPSPSYPIFLYEQLYLFQLRANQANKPYQINNPNSFLKAYSSADLVDQHLLSELYLHEYICTMDRKFIMTPYVGDIQLHDFSSYVQNQVRWEICHSATKQNEKNVILWVRGELTPPYDIWRQ